MKSDLKKASEEVTISLEHIAGALACIDMGEFPKMDDQLKKQLLELSTVAAALDTIWEENEK